VGLAQLVRFLVMKLIHSGLNIIFDMSVTFTANILSVVGDVPIDSETLLVTDFVNLNIKPAQSFEGAHKGKMCVRMFIEVSARTCMSICVYTVFLKKITISVMLVPKKSLHICFFLFTDLS
jgi:hypothetical protein